MRSTLFLLTLTFATVTASAQDMPLSQVLIDGEEWKSTTTEVIDQTAQNKISIPEVSQPTCMVHSPGRETVYVGSAVGKYVWAFRVEKDGSLSAGQPYCSLFARRGVKNMLVSALAVDRDGRIYAATPAGIQIFDPTGRLCGVVLNPTKEPITGLMLSDGQLFVGTKTGSYVRKVKTRGVSAN